MYKKIAILTKPNHTDALDLKHALEGLGHDVYINVDPPDKIAEINWFDLVISYFYPHILKDKHLDKIKRGINCHISYLPYNRGAHPNVWTIVDNIPAGVTIHELETGIDTGRIIARKEVAVYQDDTGYTLYNRLCKEMLDFTIANLETLVDGTYDTIANEYDEEGTLHYVRDLNQLRDLSSSFTPDELARLMDAIDIIRACSFNGKYPGAYIKGEGIHPGRLYIDNISLRYAE